MRYTTPKLGLSLMPEPDFLAAAQLLFDAKEVDVVEWSFDVCWGRAIPQQCQDLLNQYASINGLYGHGVGFSLLTAKRTERQVQWLDYLEKETRQLKYQDISEHFGFLMTENFVQSGVPFSMPFIPEMLEIGINNLQEIKRIAQVPVGLENLAFSFSRAEVIEQGKFISALLDAVDGFLLLDVHNIYCNMVNFSMSCEEVCATLPLHRVKRIHISGGMFRNIQYEKRKIYCDSHDAAIPSDVFHLLETILQKLTGVEAIIFERLGGTLTSHAEVKQFQMDFMTLKSLVKRVFYE